VITQDEVGTRTTGAAGREQSPRRDELAAESTAPGPATTSTKQTDTPKTAAEILPSVSLPKSGGAVRGLGEKFSVNAATGTAAMSIPLLLSPTRGGATPGLQLAYDSGAGNGPFGFGWRLEIPAITRKTDKGLPLYCDGDESDVFILAGQDDLVPILDASGARMSNSRTVYGTTYKISYYRPRIEGGFARIERWVAADTGLTHWRSLSRDNVITLYGYDATSRIADPDDPTKIFSWEISRSWDDRGNVTAYFYAHEDGAGIDVTQAHEANRTAATRGVQTYLARIQYGNLQSYRPDWTAATEAALPTDWMFSVVLDYGGHTASPPTPKRDAAWPVRPDPFSSYRAGFEVRTYRRVRRLLFFNNFPNETTAGANSLVRSLDLVYSDQIAPTDPRNPIYTFLASATQTGYRQDSTGLIVRSLPPLQFTYSTPTINSTILSLDRDSLGNLPEGIDGSRFRWVDLEGEGLSGILSDAQTGWFYKRNLSANNLVAQPDGSALARACFGPLEAVTALPSNSDLGGGQRLLALAGDGRLDVAELSDPDPGFFKRSTDESFEPFQRFLSLPKLDWTDPNLRFIDVTGDGLADILITEDGIFTFYPSLGELGFDAAQIVRVPWDEEKGPTVVFADGTETIYLADMSGDGLNDLVRVRNGEVCYWPNVGYGRFGTKVTMDQAPRFDSEERFDPHRTRLADIDGTGTADILYVGEDGVRAWYNQSGNAWSAATNIAVFPSADLLSSVQVFDLLGSGTACLVWSSPLPTGTASPLLYVDLMGGQKPHLMIGAVNNLGAETRVTYAPSTRFYVADEQAGHPWVTRLPFPVQVVERSEIFDWIGLNRLVTRYAYHHGYFDSYEREFRGFGMVEQWDTEEFRTDTNFAEGDFILSGGKIQWHNWSQQSWSPPMLTRSWFHTGAFELAPQVTQQYQSEYWNEPALSAADAAAMRPPDTVIPDGLGAFEIQEAYRALKGHALRVEVYAQDGSAAAGNPYTVTESNFTLVCLQNMGINLHAVFFVYPRETVSFHYERGTGDPRVTHDVALDCDKYGNILYQVAIAYPRRPGYAPPEPTLSAATQSMLAYDQTRLHFVGVEQLYTNAIDDLGQWPDTYRAPLPAGQNSAEITGVTPSVKGNGITNLFSFGELYSPPPAAAAIWQTAWSGAHDIPYEAIPSADIDGAGSPAAALTRRFIAQERTLYRSDDLTGLLPQGSLQSLALTGESYRAALTPGLLSGIFTTLVPAATLAEGGYVQLAGETGWWMPSGRIYFSPNATDTPAQELTIAQGDFFLPRRAVDPFGGTTLVNYDSYGLLPLTRIDPVGNVTTASNDYRVVKPAVLTDANGNRASVAFDALGLVTATAIQGKTTENLGDQLTGFTIDLDANTLLAQFAAPLTSATTLLGNATTRTIYDLSAYQRTSTTAQPLPPAVYTLARVTHVFDQGVNGYPATTQYQFAFAYSDGFNREIQRKALVAPGPVVSGGPTVTPRWAGSGWTIFDNKGRAVRKYEPFFSTTNGFEFAAQNGVSTVLFYDPPGRVVATLNPDNSWAKTVFDAWSQQGWDGNDTVLIADPRTDADVGNYFARCLGTGTFTSWHDLRIGGTYGATADDQAAQKDAAQKAAAHAATPSFTYFDSLGRSCLAIVDNGGGNRYPSRTAFDIEGKPLAIYDALGRHTQEYFYRGAQYLAGIDMAGNSLYQINADSAARRKFGNVAGNPIRGWDARGNAFRTVYDKAQRPSQRYVSTNGAAEILFELTIYGEGQPAANLCGRVFRHYDMAGYVENSQYDYAGNLVTHARQLAVGYQQATDWTPLANLTSAAQLDAAAAALLSTADKFTGTSFYDALNRPIQVVTPASASMKPNVVRPSYDQGGLLVAVDAWLQQTAAPTALLDVDTADRHAVTAITYNARGQRLSIAYGNGTGSAYLYDAETFRLTNLTTTRPSSFAANQQTAQALSYFYDPVGNITRLRDDADTQNVIYFANQRVDPTADYTYDPLYRLIQAIGREHLGQSGGALQGPQQVTNDDSFRVSLPQPGDGNAMGVYTETYGYDAVGNFLTMAHQVSSGNWTRHYTYAEPSQILAAETGNRLSTTSMPGDPAGGPFSATYAYDAHGNMVRMPHLPLLVWDELDRLRSTTRQVVNSGTPQTTYYVYDAGGQRVRKKTNASAAAGQTSVATAERIYLGGIEIYREFAADGVTATLWRETFHIDAGDGPVAFVETRTIGSDPAPAQQVRYQFHNHLKSALLELDDQSNIISYEEYFPFGSTSYQAVASQTDLPKRYRYTDRERDAENDLYYHRARYYAPWLGRWTACDPIGVRGGNNLYAYADNNPAKLTDRDGRQPQLMDVWQYGQRILNRAGLGRNVQLDHPIQVALRTAQRTAPSGTAYYSRAVSRAERELTVAVETGRGLFHTEVGKLQAAIRQQVIGGVIRSESDLVAATQAAYLQAGATTNTTVNVLARDTAILSNQATIHTTLQNTINELRALPQAPTTLSDANIEAAFADLTQVGKVEETVATAAKAVATATKAAGKAEKLLAVASKVAKAAAPVAKALKPLAPALKAAGTAAGVLSVATSAVELATAKTTDQKVDAGIGLAGNALLASDNPVLMAGGGGVLAGQYLEHKFDVSEYSSSHGIAAKEFLEKHGVNSDVALVTGGVVTVAATPVALAEGVAHKVMGLFK
jgi:RHS repeat-associated protein